MLTYDEIRERLKDRIVSNVALETGVHPNTVYGIKNGSNQNPSSKVCQALSEYFERRP
jgi:DNA-binding XRE family transcriptional regulator